MSRGGYKNPNQIQRQQGNQWFTHYFNYLSALAYQLFEWKGLPDSVDPRFLEMSIHTNGFVGFYKDKRLGYLAVQGATSGTLDQYWLPTHFHATAPQYQMTFPVYNYNDIMKENMGVVIWNNDQHFSTLPSIEMFAKDLAQLKEIIHINQNAQKTPVLITANDKTLFSLKNIYNQYEGNAPVIFTNDALDPNVFKVHKTDAPYVVDKLNVQKNAVWNEVMTWLGINNANLEKRERMITSEADSNNEQIQSSANIFLKARQEACKKINRLYGLDLSVELRMDVAQEFASNISMIGTAKEGDDNE